MGASIAAGLIAGGLGAAGSIASSVIGSNASSNASKQQVSAQDQALAAQQAQLAIENANQAPYVAGGQSTLSTLLSDLNNGTYGPGSVGAAPTYSMPTLEQVQSTPGYQFIQQQGEQGIQRGAAAAGGAITGGTLKNLATYDTNLANTSYQQQVANALQNYNANMGTYQQNLATQAQGFNQLLAPIQLGEAASANQASAGNQTTAQIANTNTNIGSAQAAGTIGSASSINSGIGGVVNAAQLPLYLYNYNQNQQNGGQLPNGQTYNVPYDPNGAGMTQTTASGTPIDANYAGIT